MQMGSPYAQKFSLCLRLSFHLFFVPLGHLQLTKFYVIHFVGARGGQASEWEPCPLPIFQQLLLCLTLTFFRPAEWMTQLVQNDISFLSCRLAKLLNKTQTIRVKNTLFYAVGYNLIQAYVVKQIVTNISFYAERQMLHGCVPWPGCRCRCHSFYFFTVCFETTRYVRNLIASLLRTIRDVTRISI